MIAVAVTAALAACLGLLAAGAALVRDPGPTHRFDTVHEIDPRGRVGSASLLRRAYARLQHVVAPPVLAVLGARRAARVRRRIEVAGRPDGMTVESYAGRKGLLTLALGVGGLLFSVATGSLLFVVLLPVAGWFLVDLSLRQRARERQEAIERALPDLLDVLSVTVSAGLGFRAALARVADAFPGPLSDEITTTLRQMSLGMHRREALEALRDRNESEALSEFITALVQAEELGAPLTDTLAEIAAEMRRTWEQDARKRASRAAPRISVIVTMTLVPAALLLIMVGFFTSSDLDISRLFGG